MHEGRAPKVRPVAGRPPPGAVGPAPGDTAGDDHPGGRSDDSDQSVGKRAGSAGSGHLGRIGAYGEQAVEAGLASVHFVNAVDHDPIVAPFGGRAVIVVNPTRTLERHTGVHLIPLPDGRALISFDAPLTIADLELMLEDAIDDHRLSGSDQAVFKAIADLLRGARRSKTVRLQQRNIIVIESRRARRRPLARSSRRTRSASGARFSA